MHESVVVDLALLQQPDDFAGLAVRNPGDGVRADAQFHQVQVLVIELPGLGPRDRELLLFDLQPLQVLQCVDGVNELLLFTPNLVTVI